jgi:hypothetical protein
LFQRTRIPHVQNDLVSDASRLLDLGGLSVDRVASDAFGGRVVHVVTADETASACPSCGVLSVTLKDRVCTRPRDCATALHSRSFTELFRTLRTRKLQGADQDGGWRHAPLVVRPAARDRLMGSGTKGSSATLGQPATQLG